MSPRTSGSQYNIIPSVFRLVVLVQVFYNFNLITLNFNVICLLHELNSRDLLFNMSTVISTEVRAQWNNKVQHNQYVTMYGLNCFSPVVNIMRHPLWGRNQETYGEDPYLSGELAKSFVKGLKGDNKKYVKVGATCKHFDVHGGPENIPVSRLSFDARVSLNIYSFTFIYV